MWSKALVMGLYVGFSVTVASVASANPLKLLVVGDSISAGYGVASGEGWVDLLPKSLTVDMDVTNASISGETTVGGLARFDGLLSKHSPDIVVIELGGNDGLRGYPLKRIAQNLDSMINAAKSSGSCGVVLLGMRIPPNYGARYSDGFFNIYSELANQHNLEYVSFFLQDVADQPKLMQKDGIHPTQEAQPKLVENALPAIQRAADYCHQAAG